MYTFFSPYYYEKTIMESLSYNAIYNRYVVRIITKDLISRNCTCFVRFYTLCIKYSSFVSPNPFALHSYYRRQHFSLFLSL